MIHGGSGLREDHQTLEKSNAVKTRQKLRDMQENKSKEFKLTKGSS